MSEMTGLIFHVIFRRPCYLDSFPCRTSIIYSSTLYLWTVHLHYIHSATHNDTQQLFCIAFIQEPDNYGPSHISST